MKKICFFLSIIACTLMLGTAGAACPEYLYDGDLAIAGPNNLYDSLDGTWGHDNGSDKWDGSVPGEGIQGGAAALEEDGVTFLRIQDTGDPRKVGAAEPSNRKVYFEHLIDRGLDGTRLMFNTRIATTGVLDDTTGSDGTAPWPADGISYHIRDSGKGMIGIGKPGVGILSFSLARQADVNGVPGFEDVTGDILVMNNLVGMEATGDVDTGDTSEEIVARNWIAIDDVTQWNSVIVDVMAGGAGTHILSVAVNGGRAQMLEVTAGSGTQGDAPYIAMGSSGTGATTAFDVDYIAINATPDAYTYDGDAAIAGPNDLYDSLDSTWGHDNGSDKWDGSAPGEGIQGGAAALEEDGVTYLRIQDTGDPRKVGAAEPSNRKVYFERPIDGGLDCATLKFNTRIATTGVLDPTTSSDGEMPWPAEGIAYHIRDGGKGMIGIGEPGVGILSFSLARQADVNGIPGFEDVTGDILVMNNLVGTEATGDVDTGDTSEAIVARNWMPVDDVTQWNAVAIDIMAGGAGTHIVSVSVNGGLAQSFEVTAGSGTHAG